MDSKIALDKIKEIERKAQEIVERAKGDSKRILSEAAQEKERIINAAKTQAMLQAQGLRDKIHGDTQREVALIEKQAEGERRILKEKAQGNFDKALDFLKTKV